MVILTFYWIVFGSVHSSVNDLYFYNPNTPVFINGPKDLGSIPGSVIPKTLRMVRDASLLNTQ